MDVAVGVSHYRTIWISDIHLGTRGCSADALLDFLKFTESEYLYLVGDIIDGWRLRSGWYWPVRGSLLRRSSRLIADALRPSRRAISAWDCPASRSRAISYRSSRPR